MSILGFILCSCMLLHNDKYVTLYNNENLKGLVLCIVDSNQWQNRYRYSHDIDGTITQTRIIAATGKTFTITKTTNDKFGNTVKVSEIAPQDSPEWHSATIDYDYDNRGNWITRKINGCDPRLMNSDTNATRKIYYIEK